MSKSGPGDQTNGAIKGAEEPGGSCFTRMADKFPRITTICFRIVMPMIVLVLIATISGIFLARLEAPNEYDQNDAIMAKRFVLGSLPINETISAMGQLPLWCYERLLDGAANQTFDEPADPLLRDFASLSKWLVDNHPVPDDMEEELEDIVEDFQDFDPAVWVGSLNAALENSREFMAACGAAAENMTRRILGISSEITLLTAANTMSFDWIRCWNVTNLGTLGQYSGDQDIYEAASNQAVFYEHTWREDQERLFNHYLEEGDSGLKAWENSIRHATGRDECSENTSGTAWFWFTVMTTVGYGNQAPVTRGGRGMIITVGFLSILAFGGILATAGGVLKVIFHDMVNRWNGAHFLTRPGPGTLLWGSVAVAWMAFLGGRARYWWDKRLDLDVSRSESFWFGYISSTTVGLGDYFLQPEVIFLEDVFRFSLIYLTGFVFTSAFLGSLEEFVSTALPMLNVTDKLEERLQRTNLLNMESTGQLDELDDNENENETTKTLGALIDSKKEEDVPGTSLALLYKEQQLLATLTQQVEGELIAQVNQKVSKEELGEAAKPARELSEILKEEESLEHLLEQIRKERLLVEQASRSEEPRMEEIQQ